MRRLLHALAPMGSMVALAFLPLAADRAPAGAEAEHEEAKFDRPDEFQRYHAAIRSPDDGSGRTYEPGYLVKAYEAAQAAAKTAQLLPWEEHGPANVAGRTRALVRAQNDPSNNVWLAGTAGGGIWKTTNGGVSWRNVSGSMPNLAVSTITQAGIGTWYAGTGEGFGNADAIRGSGIFKSVDGGETWTSLPTSFAVSGITTVNRLVAIAFQDSSRVVAATSTGIYLTTDAGATWTRSTTVTAATKDLVATPDYSVMLATVDGTCSTTPPRIYRSTDRGGTWTLTTGSTIAGGRSELAIAPSDPNRVYATVDACDGTSRLHVSTDAGATWTAVANASNSDWLGDQGWYDNSIAVHPFNPDLIFVGGIDLWSGVVTGVGASPSATFTRRTAWNASTTASNYIHADNHAIVPYVTNAATQSFGLFTATDGGMFVSTNGGTSWSARNGGLRTTQFYGVDKKPGGSLYIAGAQDNGTWISPALPTETANWGARLGGDGFDTAYNENGQYVGTIQNGRFFRLSDAGGSATTIQTGLTGNGGSTWPFITQLGHTRAEPARLLTGNADGMWRTDDFGSSWEPAVLNFTGVANAKWGPSTLRIHAHVSQADARVVWAGSRLSSNGNLWLSRDGGASYRPTPLPAGIAAFLSGLASHPTDRATAYALMSTVNATKVLRTTDFGQTWTPLSGTFTTGAALSSNGFPNVATYSLLAMPHNPNHLWAGTEIGLFESTNGGASWSYANNGLPPVSVWQMKISDGRIVVATHGRGIWSLAVPELAAYQPPRGLTPPLLAAAGFNTSGKVTATGTARGTYDSLVVKVDGVTVARLTGVASGGSFSAEGAVATSPARTVQVQAVGYSAGEGYFSTIRQVAVFPALEAVVSYSNTFDTAAQGNDFSTSGPGFGIRTVSGFPTSVAAVLTSPYADATEYVYTFLRPIRVAGTGATIEFDEVALLEPCNDASATCTGGGFYDYAVVEASSDGTTWRELSPKYDSRAHPEWLAAYTGSFNATTLTSTAVPTTAMVRERSVSLTPTFAPNTLVTLRFRLSSDVNTNGWGWLIDNLSVQPSGVSNETAEAVRATDLRAPFPNPLRGSGTVEVAMATAGPAEVFVVDVLGRRVATLHTGLLAPGTHRLALDASGLSDGLYFVRLAAGNVQKTRALTVVR